MTGIRIVSLLALSAVFACALLPAGGAAQDATKAPALFVAVGHDGTRIVSADGQEWKHLQTGKEGQVYRAVCYGNGRYVAVGNYGGNNIIAVTTDGATWKTFEQEAKYVNFLRGIVFGNGTIYGIGGDPGAVGSSRPFLRSTTDGLTWGEMQQVGGQHMLRRMAYGNGLFVAVGDRGRRAASPDCKEWKDAPAVKAIDTLVDVAYGNSVFVGVGLHGLRMSSADGLQWNNRQVGEEGEHLNSVVWADNRFVAVGIGATFTSPDGVAWQRYENRNAPITMAYGNGVFVGARWRGRLLRSTDAIQWTQVLQCEHHIEAVTHGGG